jgi:arginine repressor
MPTTNEKLLELAAQYEEKARALRLAAAELNGHLTTKAKGKFDAKLQAAIELRGERGKRGTSSEKHAEMEARYETLRAILNRESVDSHGHKTGDIEHALSEEGIRIGRKTIYHALRAVGAVKTGSTQKARWVLASNNHPPRAAKSKPKRTIREQRQATAKLLKRIARAKTPTPSGMIGPVTGALVRRGYLQKTDDGYTRTDKPYLVEP